MSGFNIVYPYKPKFRVVYFLVIFALFLNGLFIKWNFALKPFQIFTVILLMFSLIIGVYSVRPKLLLIQSHDIVFIIFLLLGVFSLIYPWIMNLTSGIRLIGNLLLIFIYYLLGKRLLKRITPIEIVNYLLIASSIYVVFSILIFLEAYFNILGFSEILKLHHLGLVKTGAILIRMTGLDIDPNFFVLYLTPGLILSAYIILDKKIKTNKKLAFIVFFLSLGCLFATLSRSGILINVVVLLFIVINKKEKRNLGRQLIVLGTILLGFVIFHSKLYYRFIQLVKYIQTVSQFSEIYGRERYSLVLFGMNLFLQKPITGIGINQFGVYFKYMFGEIRYSHNTYLSTLIELGIPGFIFFLAYLSLIFYQLKQAKSSVSENFRWVYDVVILIMLSQCLQILFLYAIASSSIWLMFMVASILLIYGKGNFKRKYTGRFNAA